MNKTLATVGVTALVGTGIGGIILDVAVESKPEEANRFASILEEKELTSLTPQERQLTQRVRALLIGRGKRKEPSTAQWNNVETAIDQERAIQDTPYLQRLDRFIETMDASDKKVRNRVANILES